MSVHASIAYLFFHYNIAWAYVVSGFLVGASLMVILYLLSFLYRYHKNPDAISESIKTKLSEIRNSIDNYNDLYKGFSKAFMIVMSFGYVYFANSIIMGAIYAYFFVFIVLYDSLVLNIVTKSSSKQ